MKKKKINNLQLNKKSISNFVSAQLKGQGLATSQIYLTDFPTMIFYFNEKGQCLCLSDGCQNM